MNTPSETFVGVAGHKLRHALTEFGISAQGRVCADFGCHIGGFTDCLLRDGADRVYAVDTGYGILDYRLRTDSRVVVMERTNVLHAEPPAGQPISLIAIDVGWTPQARVLPIACRWLADGADPAIISLIKPHYELSAMDESTQRNLIGSSELSHPDMPARSRRVSGRRHQIVLPDEVADRILEHLRREVFPAAGVRISACVQSPIRGGTSRSHRPGNIEFLALLRPVKQ